MSDRFRELGPRDWDKLIRDLKELDAEFANLIQAALASPAATAVNFEILLARVDDLENLLSIHAALLSNHSAEIAANTAAIAALTTRMTAAEVTLVIHQADIDMGIAVFTDHEIRITALGG